MRNKTKGKERIQEIHTGYREVFINDLIIANVKVKVILIIEKNYND